jgi:iron complex transport system permease protein
VTPSAPRERRHGWRWLALGVSVLLVLALSVFLGRYPTPGFTPPQALMDDELARSVVLELRLPRVLLAFLTGAALAGSGAAFQMVFRNPLVESGFLGVSQGAAFGACLAIVLLGGAPGVVQLSAAFFALLGLGAATAVATRVRIGDWVLRLILSGIAVSAIYAAGTGILKVLADPLDQLPDLTFWLLGGLWGVEWVDLAHIAPVVIPALVVLWAMRWRLNLLALRDETAFSLGSRLALERLVLLLAAVLATAAVVSKAGLVGWVGLIVPHLARGVLGADAQRALPGAMLMGGAFCLLCDDLARVATSGELPLGIVTSLAGAALFVVIMLRWRGGWRR